MSGTAWGGTSCEKEPTVRNTSIWFTFFPLFYPFSPLFSLFQRTTRPSPFIYPPERTSNRLFYASRIQRVLATVRLDVSHSPLFIPRPLDDRGPFLFHKHLPSSLTYPQARPLSLVVQGSAWGEGFPPSTTQQATRHVTITTCCCHADFIIVRSFIIVPTFIVVPLSPWQRRFL